jgi:hypothetical protein
VIDPLAGPAAYSAALGFFFAAMKSWRFSHIQPSEASR